MTFTEANEYMHRHSDSYNRMGMLIGFAGKVKRLDWLAMVGEHWSGCDNVWEHHNQLRDLLGCSGPVRQMMTVDENAAYDALPLIRDYYRGCGPHNLRGASWSLDKEVANAFPFMSRYKVLNPLLLTATVSKDRILAVKLDREEAEIITFKHRRKSVQPANQESADARSSASHAEMRERLKQVMALHSKPL